MKSFNDLINECLPHIEEVFPWDIEELAREAPDLLVLDVREPAEYEAMHIVDSVNVPRGVLETACEFGYEETVAELARARDRDIVVVCRSGNRSALAAFTMQLMGYRQVYSMKTGLRGWNDYELPLFDSNGAQVDIDSADRFFAAQLTPEQKGPDPGA